MAWDKLDELEKLVKNAISSQIQKKEMHDQNPSNEEIEKALSLQFKNINEKLWPMIL